MHHHPLQGPPFGTLLATLLEKIFDFGCKVAKCIAASTFFNTVVLLDVALESVEADLKGHPCN